MSDVEERVAVAERAASAGAAVALALFRSDLDVETKAGKTDVVTRADREAQARVAEVLREAFPAEPVVGEEGDGPKALPDDGPAWIVDPVDGTNNFVREVPYWATSVAGVVDGEAVAAANVLPALGETYVAGPDGATLDGDPIAVSGKTDPETFAVVPTVWWGYDRRAEYAAACREIVERFADLRRFGSAQAVLSMVAAGRLEGTITNVRVNPWDSVAGVLLVEGAGGTVTDVDGEPWKPGCEGLVASNGEAHDEVLAAARGIGG